MSKKNKPKSQERAKPKSSNKAITIIVCLCFLGIIPLLVWSTLPEESPYESVTSSSVMVQRAAADSGMELCSSEIIDTKVPGATSSVLYKLSPNCESKNSADLVQVLVLGFSSTDAMDSAIYEAQVTHQNWKTLNIAAFKSGYNVILVQGAPANEAVSQISDSLVEQGAVRIL